MALVLGVSCRCASPEARMGPSVVSLADFLVSEWPEAAPAGVERMVFRVGLGIHASLLLENRGRVDGAGLRCSLSMYRPAGAHGTVGGVTGGFPGV